ncbi:hypothetical protein I204_07069 [Kwoniella mangroviensis CBS 8886]|nr:hypothetical protein I204_07069 [Kwoniella mangroviensis CBS 8886]
MSRDSQESRALIVWRPRYLFFPPVQEPPPPTRVFRHVDLIEEEEARCKEYESMRSFLGPSTALLHTPNHEIIFPQIFLNNTFLRFLRNPPRQLPIIKLTSQHSSNYDTTHSDSTNVRSDPTRQTEAYIEEIHEDNEEAESSLESIDETSTFPFPSKQIEYVANKPTKITLKRKSQDMHEEDDVFSSIYQPSSANLSSKKAKSDDDAAKEQWRVGRRPGFQGSFVAPKRTSSGEENSNESVNDSGKKRTLSQNITSSAEKVLKKPFKPPTRISPSIKSRSKPQLKSRDLVEVSSPSTSPTEKNHEKINTPSTPQNKFSFPKVDPFFPDFPTPPSSSSSPSRSVQSRKIKPVKPFKSPIRTNRSSAPSPSSISTTNKPGNNTVYPTSKVSTDEKCKLQSKYNELKKLQNEVMISKQAIKYIREDDNTRLKELIDMWKNAGREVVEKLFGIVPEPVQSDGPTNMNYSSSNHPVSSSYWNSSTSSSSMSSAIGEDQMEFIRNARRNDNGDIIDDEGNVMMIGEDEGDIQQFWNNLGTNQHYNKSESGNRSSRYQYNYDKYDLNHTKYDHEDQSSSYENQFQVDIQSNEQGWNYARLMKMFSVDPDLFGWDPVEEDWMEQDEE